MTTCPYCQAIARQNKAGKTNAGAQRYYCRRCRRRYTPEPKSGFSSTSMRERPSEMHVDRVQSSGSAPRLKAAYQMVVLRLTGTAQALRNAASSLVNNVTMRPSRHTYASIKMQTTQQLAVAVPVERNARFLGHATISAHTYSIWGRIPEIALIQSGSLLLIAWAFVAARAGAMWSEAVFWIGLASLIVPVAIRLYSSQASRRERIALILLLGAAFYLVKVMHSPYAFTFPDEFSTFRNVREILENQRLFQENPELPATALYPSLSTVTSILVSFSGLSTFSAGLFVIGAARLVLFLGLFLLYERVSGSARIAGLGTLFYMANTNFLFYTAEFSYESLALPMAIFVLYIVARRETTNEHRRALTVVALFGVFMVVISHHMTSYILTALLFAATGISILWTRGSQRGPWDLALIAALATTFWLVYVATYTIQYLSPVLFHAVHSVVRLATKEETSRQLFKSNFTDYVSPLWEQLTVFASLLIIALGLPVGWLNLWRRYRNQIFFLLLGVIALGFLPMQGLRFTSAGWETANRSSAFLFIGVAFVLALAIDQLWRSSLISWQSVWIQVVIAVILIFGGFIAGWPPQARMSRPYFVDTGSHIVEPQMVEVAKWTFDYLGPDHRIATSKVGAKLLSAYGEQTTFTRSKYGIKHVLLSKGFGSNEMKIIRDVGIEYIVSDRRTLSWDLMIGFFFLNLKSSPSYEFLEFETFQKFDGLEGVNRILDSGDIVVYDVNVYLRADLEARKMPAPAIGIQSRQAAADHSRSAEKGVTSINQDEKDVLPTPFPVGPPASSDLERETPSSRACLNCWRDRTTRIEPGYNSPRHHIVEVISILSLVTRRVIWNTKQEKSS